MHRYAWLHVSAILLITGCGGAAGSGTLAFSDVAVSFARSTPVPAREVASESECVTAAECQRACEAGQLQSCTRWGDLLHAEEPARAEAAWLDACRRRDGIACVRMMALAASEPRTADAYARHACAYGAVSACELLGAILMLRGAGGKDEQQAAFLRDAAEVFEIGCGFGHWRSCLWAGDLYEQKELGGESSHREQLIARSFELATSACENGNPDACLFRGEILDQLGAIEDAKASYARSCRLFLESAVNISYAHAMRDLLCHRASELGVAPPPGSIDRTEPPGLRHVSQAVVEARRISGTGMIFPSTAVRLQMQRRGVRRIGAVVNFCLSPSGLVQSLHFKGASGFPVYDLALLETMRTWRYSPYMVDGKASPVCTEVTFVYDQID
jgi:TonB family protein